MPAGMVGSPTLAEAFEAGTLVRPSHARPNLVHAVRAVATITGVQDLDGAPPVQEISKLIGPSEHIIFVLLDGLGLNVVRQLPPDSLLRSSLKMELTATCPSTTAAALTSVATAQYPNRHAITGWFTYLPEYGFSIATLPFIERATGQLLTLKGIQVGHVLPVPPVCPRMSHKALTVVPSAIANTTYNTFGRGGTEGIGYVSIPNAVDEIIAHLRAARQPTYVHLYLPEVDSLCHKAGALHERVFDLVMEIDRDLRRLADAVAGKAKIVISADHGLIDVPKPDQTLLLDGDPMLDLLVVPPTGDARMPIFHVRDGKREQFVDHFNARFSDRMILTPTQEIEQMELLGPGALSETARARFGDFIGFPYRAATLAYHPPHKPVGELFLAVHAGLSPQEMWIPLCIV